MKDFILLMHDDIPESRNTEPDDWMIYFSRLRSLAAFQGGSAIGDGVCMSKSDECRTPITRRISGYIRIQAENLQAARGLVMGNPVYEAGGTVEIRELPRST